MASCPDVQCVIDTLIRTYRASDRHKAVHQKVDDLMFTQGDPLAQLESTTWLTKTWWVFVRFLLNYSRSITAFGLRLIMAIGLALTLGTIFFQLDKSWPDTTAAVSMLFFVVAFLTFTSISALPELMQDNKIFTREKMNGWYGTSTFVIANTLASLPFIFTVAISSSVLMYFLAGLRGTGTAFMEFTINLFLSLTAVESLLLPVAAVVGHFLAGIAIGSGILGIFMLVCGFFMQASELPDPVWRYPLHYLAYHTYSFRGFMNTQFLGNDGWACPCTVQNTCAAEQGGAACVMPGSDVLGFYSIKNVPWGEDMAVLVAFIVAYRILFWVITYVRDSRGTKASKMSTPEEWKALAKAGKSAEEA